MILPDPKRKAQMQMRQMAIPDTSPQPAYARHLAERRYAIIEGVIEPDAGRDTPGTRRHGP